jgi:hypothetical protein
MGKHGAAYKRIAHDHYVTPRWTVEALIDHLDVVGTVIWEPAAGTGAMAEVFKAAGAAQVYCTDIADYGYPLDGIHDFRS